MSLFCVRLTFTISIDGFYNATNVSGVKDFDTFRPIKAPVTHGSNSAEFIWLDLNDDYLKQWEKFCLRRRIKEDVATDIPSKEETVIDVELTSIQKQYYRAIFEHNHAFLSLGATRQSAPKLMNIQMELRKVSLAENRFLCITPSMLAWTNTCCNFFLKTSLIWCRCAITHSCWRESSIARLTDNTKNFLRWDLLKARRQKSSTKWSRSRGW